MTYGRAFFRALFPVAICLTAFSSLASAQCVGTSSNQTCTSTVSVSVPQNSHASPYPVSQTVGTPTAMSGAVTHVDVTINGLNAPDSFNSGELMLVAPNGTQLVIMVWPGDGGTAFSGNLQVIDTGADQCQGLPLTSPALAQNCNDPTNGTLETGPGQPDGFSGVSAPGSSCTAATCVSATPPSRTMDNTFSAVTNANGTWSLYVINNAPFPPSPTYTFTGWTIHVTTSGAAAAGTTTSVSPANQSVLRTTPGASDPATITAMVSSGSTVNGGTVSFFDHGNPVVCSGGNQTVVNGQATCVLTFAQEGVHPITANYGGASGFAPSDSPVNSPANVTVADRTHTSNVTATGGTFCNQGSILQSGNFGPGNPYPSNIFVGTNGSPNLAGVITGLTLDTLGDTANNADNISMLLVSPAGTPYLIWSHAFQNLNSPSGPVDIHFADGHTLLPSTGGLVGGTFSPTDYASTASNDQGVFPAPAPQTGFLFPATTGNTVPGGAQTFQLAYNGAGATGTWSLYVLNQGTNTGGVNNGWCLNFTVNPNETATTTTVNATPAQSYTSSPFTSQFPPAPVNDYVIFTAHTASATTGSVTFTDNGVNLTCTNGTLNPAPVNGGGTAVCNTTFSTEGNHFIRAAFHDAGGSFGDSNGTTLERVDSHSTKSVNGATYTYCNPAQIHIPGFSVAAAPANPYPSNIFINDLPGTINHVTLSLPDLAVPNGSASRDLTSLLVGPNRTIADSLDLFSHVGLDTGNFTVNVTLDDGAGANLTQASNPTTGSFKPTSFNTPTYPSLSPAGPYPPPAGTPQYASPSGAFTFSSVFGTGPGNTRTGDGTWSLFQQATVDGDAITEGNGTNLAGWCLNFTVNPPVLTISKSDQGLHFRQGQSGAQYKLTVTNNGPGLTGGITTVVDTLAASLSFASGSGTDWTCGAVGQMVTCTNSDAIAAGGSFPVLTLNVNVANNAPTPVANQASVSGGGSVGTANSNTTSTTVDQAPDLTITKMHSGNFRQGDSGDTYTITVTNSGAGPTSGTVTVTDAVPSGLTATAIAGTNWACTQPAGPCTRNDVLAPSASYEPITLTVNVAQNAPATVTNTATVSGGGELNTANDTANDPTTIVPASDMTIAKSHSGNFRQGDTGDTYLITATNSGGGATSGTVSVSDTVPSGLTATSIAGTGWTCTQPSGPCTRNDVLAASASYPAITLTVNVANNAPASVTNMATVSGGGEFNTANDTATDPTTVVQAADLTIAKSHSGNFRQGDTGDTYTITVSNAGPGPTVGTVSVSDTVPSGLTATSIAGTGWTCTQPSGPCSRADVLAVSASYPVITLTVNVANNAPASVTNSATVSGGGELNTANDTATDPTTVVQAADLTIAKSHSGNFRQGDVGDTYTITVTNAGPGPTVGTVSLSDTLPTGLTATSIAGTGWTCNQPAGPCSRADVLAASASYPAITLTVNVANDATASVTNSATVSGGGELNTANDTATDPTTVVQAADLTIAKSHSGNFRQGDTGDTYTITVSNAGPGPTVGTVSVSDTVPSGLTATSIAGTGWTCTQPAGPCSRADVLAASASYPVITLTVNVANNAPASVTNSATVSGGGELNTANDTATDPTTVVQVADLTIAKSHSGNFRQGDTGDTYTITVSNAGPGPTVGTVSVSDTVPSGLTATSVAGTGWTCTQPAGPCSRADVLAASASYPAITLTVNVANNAPASVTNSAAVSGGGELNTGNDSASDPTTVIQVADLTISKSHSGNFAVGDTGRTYTITVSNIGPGPTVGSVSVSDTVPSGLTATSIAGTGWTCTQPAGPCSRADVLAASASYPAITLTVNVANNAPNSVTNVATVSGGGELNTSNDTASDVTSVLIPTTTVVSAASGQYSDSTTLTATVSPASFNSQTLSGTVMFNVNGNAAGSAPVNGAGVASVPYSIQLAAGSYPITAQFVSSNPAFGNSGGSNTLTVTPEDATVTPSSSNPFSVSVNSPGGTAGPITLSAAITETPDDATPGNISNAVPVTCTLTPIVSAPTLTQTATVTGGGVGGTLNASCTFNNVPVNVYDVTFTVGGNFYTGVSPVTVLAVFDATAGSTTGGGTLTHNSVKANFGFNAKYKNDGSPQGSLDYVEHRSTGDVHIKGDTVESLSVVGNTAVFIIQVTLNGVAGYKAQVTVTDNGEPGAGHDTFGLQVTAPNNSTVSDLTFSPITIDGGNIQIH